MINLVHAKSKEIINFQDTIKTDKLNYESKHRKVYSFSEYSMPI